MLHNNTNICCLKVSKVVLMRVANVSNSETQRIGFNFAEHCYIFKIRVKAVKFRQLNGGSKLRIDLRIVT